jgi:dUTP pyrophosphatase
MKVRIKRLDPSVPLPRYQTPHSAGFDIAASEDVRVAPGEVRLIPTGLVAEAPEGYFLALFIRSSAPIKKGLTLANGVGVVDRDYSGPSDQILIEVLNFTDSAVEVRKGERIAQGMFLRVDQVEWEEVDEVRVPSRGGFGSTGR